MVEIGEDGVGRAWDLCPVDHHEVGRRGELQGLDARAFGARQRCLHHTGDMGVVGDLGGVVRVSDVVVADASARGVADEVDLRRAARRDRTVDKGIEVVQRRGGAGYRVPVEGIEEVGAVAIGGEPAGEALPGVAGGEEAMNEDDGVARPIAVGGREAACGALIERRVWRLVGGDARAIARTRAITRTRPFA